MNGFYICRFTPELIIDGDDIIKAGFTPGAAFKIEPYRDSLVITLVSAEGEIEQLLLEIDATLNFDVDWIRDNGELYLTGDWLTQCGLTGQPLAIGVMLGKVVLKIQQDNMLA